MLLVRRADDQNRPGVGDRFGDLFEEVLILGGAVAGAFLSDLKIADRAVGVDDDGVGVVGVEMENAGLTMIDPDDGVIMALHRAGS
ncbi:MAG: hypothetical protein ABR878_18270 [Roseiarcus sp.]